MTSEELLERVECSLMADRSLDVDLAVHFGLLTWFHSKNGHFLVNFLDGWWGGFRDEKDSVKGFTPALAVLAMTLRAKAEKEGKS